MTTHQPTDAQTRAVGLGRDPQSFTPGDRLAWKIVAFAFGGLTVAGAVTGLAVLATLVSS